MTKLEIVLFEAKIASDGGRFSSLIAAEGRFGAMSEGKRLPFTD